MARLTILIFHGVTLAWALIPDSGLRETAESVWGLIGPALAPPSQ
jgi:hypothetical protein